MKIIVKGIIVEQVKKFRNFGGVITFHTKCHNEIKRRIVWISEQAFTERGELLRNELDKALKNSLLKLLVWRVVLHGAETWTLEEKDVKALEAFENQLDRTYHK